MKHKLSDNRWLMASYNDISSFFEENKIVGKVIKDILPFKLDYRISNLEDIENIFSVSANSSISTDGQICLIFNDGTSLEVEFSGEGPLILGYNTADFTSYPDYDGSCYTLKTMFRHCINKTIERIDFEKTNTAMMFPCYKGINISSVSGSSAGGLSFPLPLPPSFPLPFPPIPSAHDEISIENWFSSRKYFW